MVVDDDNGIANLLSIMLKGNGYFPITATNGSVALEMLKHCPLPSLILTDYSMPVMNGCEFIEHIAQQSHLQHIPILIMTGSAIEDLRLPNTQNFKGLIQKPFKISTMLENIHYFTVTADYFPRVCPA
jgi:CheY-like chemotaxis protein